MINSLDRPTAVHTSSMQLFLRRTLVVLMVILLFRLAVFMTSELPGGSFSIFPRRAGRPKTSYDLRQELGSKVPESVYATFTIAVEYHQNLDFDKAIEIYEQLQSVELPNATPTDILARSSIIRHNLSDARRRHPIS